MKLGIIFGLVVVAVAIVVGGWFLSSQTAEAPTLSPALQPVAVEVPVEAVGLPADSGSVNDVQVETALLSAVGTYEGSGRATRAFDGVVFAHAVVADIGDPPADKFYEGWLVMKTEADPVFLSTGRLDKSADQYVLTYSATQDYPSHSGVVVTEETLANGLDNEPEAHVLEGSF